MIPATQPHFQREDVSSLRCLLGKKTKNGDTVTLPSTGADASIKEIRGLLKCPVCFEVYRNASMCPLGHTQCRQCFTVTNASNLRCGSCRTVFSSKEEPGGLRPNFLVRQMVDVMTVKCSLGCGWTGSRSQEETHWKTACPVHKVNCSNSGCQVTRLRCEINRHLLECPEQVVKCDLCQSLQVKLKNFTQHQVNECPSRLLMCVQNGGCRQVMKASLMAKHLQNDCPAQTIMCPACQQSLLRGILITHLEQCDQVRVFCPQKCGTLDLFRQPSVLAQHLGVSCPEDQITCPHGCRQIDVIDDSPVDESSSKPFTRTRREMTDHLEKFCPGRPVCCPYSEADFGICEWSGRALELDDHLRDAMATHLESLKTLHLKNRNSLSTPLASASSSSSHDSLIVNLKAPQAFDCRVMLSGPQRNPEIEIRVFFDPQNFLGSLCFTLSHLRGNDRGTVAITVFGYRESYPRNKEIWRKRAALVPQSKLALRPSSHDNVSFLSSIESYDFLAFHACLE